MYSVVFVDRNTFAEAKRNEFKYFNDALSFVNGYISTMKYNEVFIINFRPTDSSIVTLYSIGDFSISFYENNDIIVPNSNRSYYNFSQTKFHISQADYNI